MATFQLDIIPDNVFSVTLYKLGRNHPIFASALVGAVVAPVAVISGLFLLGFGRGGIIRGSLLAGIQSGIGDVVKGSRFAFFQSIGAGAFRIPTLLVVSAIGSIIAMQNQQSALAILKTFNRIFAFLR
eukprot:TRINITY_DN12830_c0_g1_i1.p1 TRINITY_DN12830_c0_g1~~TRINITY_DN12830_c0_g1_i1.p1  ORF type:complete len:128 (+),score=10.55 TRINITY_DN12830_c0_g1_i1:117-500(+)